MKGVATFDENTLQLMKNEMTTKKQQQLKAVIQE